MIKIVIVPFFAGFLTIYGLAAFGLAATGLSKNRSPAPAMFEASLQSAAALSRCSGASAGFFVCNGAPSVN